jgi:dienelactone hydrolase
LELGLKTKNSVVLRIILVTLLAIGFLALYIFAKGSPQRPELNVIEKTDLCSNIMVDQNDISSYGDFIKKNRRYRKPVSKSKLSRQIKDAEYYLEARPSGKTAKDLRKIIISALNIGFLLHNLNERELVVKVIAIQQYEGFTENKLLFEDPQVGTFSVLFLVPDKGKGSHPAIVGLHGHNSGNEKFRDDYFGKELAREGFVVIMPSFRAMVSNEIETAISEELYLNGFTLMGLRIYETLLIIKYLKYKNFVDKIGIMGHSGGSYVAYLASIISPDLQALVYDMYPEPLNMYNAQIHCETIPNLAYYSPQIKNSAILKIPSRKIKYGYSRPDDRRKLTVFFKKRLMEQFASSP